MSASIDDTLQSTGHGALAVRETSTAFAALFGEPPPSPSPRIGKYVLGDSLGSGGMGEVFLATDTQLGRKVAIKLLRLRKQDDPLERTRLLREAQALAALNDANVVGVYECGLHGDQVFIAMELVEGLTLRSWQDDAPRGWREVLRHYIAAGQGLTAIHAAGLVHRDFKPQNVLVGATGRVKITDFGLAVTPGQRAVPAEAGAVRARLLSLLATQLTASATVLGTPLYISPEQLAARPIDARSDQFSFCVALYEALYGSHPYAEPDPATQGHAATVGLGAVGRGPSGTPSMMSLVAGLIEGPLRRPQKLGIPRRVYAAIERGLARDPADRWPSMPALLATLTRDPLRKYGPWVAVAGVSAMVGAAVLIPEVVSQCKDIEADFRNAWTPASAAAIEQAFHATGSPHAGRAAKLVNQTVDDYRRQWLAARIDNCDATHDRAAQDAEVHRRRDTCLDHARDTLAAMVLQLGHADAAAVETVSDALALLPALEECSPAFQRQQTCLDGIDEPALRDRLDHARGLEVAGKFADASAAADGILADDPALPPRLAAEAQLLRGRVLAEQRRGAEASAAFTAAFDLSEGAGCDSLGFAAATGHTKLVALHHDLPADTGLVWSAVAQSKLGKLPASPRLAAEQHSDLGLLLQHREDLAGSRAEHLGRARSEHDAALALREQIAGDRPTPELAISYLNLGALEATHDRHELGLDRLHRALDLYIAVYGPDHPTLWKPYRNLGNALLRLDRTTEARPALERGIAVVEAGLGTGHAALGPLQYALATSYVDENPAHALALATVALATYVREIPDADPQRVDPLVLLGQIHTDRHEPGLALPHREEVLRRLGRASPEDRASAHLDLALTLHELARPQEALAHLQLAEAILGELDTGSSTDLTADIRALRTEVLRSPT